MITYTVVNHTRVSNDLIRRTESAIVRQVNRQVHAWWHSPLIAFRRSGGWKIDIVPVSYAKKICGGYPACHGVSMGRPTALVGSVRNIYQFEQLFDHEIGETTVDPFLRGREIYDPVDGFGYFSGSIFMADFVTPNYYNGHPGKRIVNHA